VGEAVLGVVAEAGEEVAERQRADHVDREGAPGPAPRRVRSRLGKADAGESADDAAGVDRGEATEVEPGGAYLGVSYQRRWTW
jgi:hypothetical protein